jgi:hypothetical protein
MVTCAQYSARSDCVNIFGRLERFLPLLAGEAAVDSFGCTAVQKSHAGCSGAFLATAS